MSKGNINYKYLRRRKSWFRRNIPLVIMWAVIAVVVIVLGILSISGIFDQTEDVQIVTESNLHKIIEVSQLSTYECVYNDICTVMDEDDSSKVAYYCKYKGRVKAGIDFTKVDIKMEEQESGEYLITVTLPKVTLDDPEVDIDSLKYMFQEKKANDGTVSGEAYKACIQDIKEKSKSETMIYKTAQQNAENTIKGLVEPFVRNAETSEDHYKVKIITSEENAK